MSKEKRLLARDIRKSIRQQVGAEAFDATPGRLWWVVGHLCVVVACCFAIRTIDNLVFLVVCGVLIGHANLCLGFLGHDYSHGTVLRGRARYLVGVLIWAPASWCASVWDANHIEVHHHSTNTQGDSIRYFASDERSRFRTAFALLFYPNRHLPWSPFQALFSTVRAVGSNLCALFGVSSREFGYLTGLRHFTLRERVKVAFELAVVVGYRVSVISLAGGYTAKYFFVGTLPSLFASMIASAYLHTQHTLHPLDHEDDPLGATSLRMPKWVDVLHFNVSHHTAHHLFEGMNSKYLPKVTRLLEQKFPEALDRRGMFEALRLANRNELYKAVPEAEPVSRESLLASA